MSMKGLYQECKVGFIFSELFTLKMARKMVTITQYAKQKKRHRCTQQTVGLCGGRRGWDVSREQHRNMYII